MNDAKPMTIEQIAENMTEAWPPPGTQAQAYHATLQVLKEVYAKGFADAKEKAARIAEEDTCDLGAPCSFTAKDIRALESDK